MDGRHAGQSLGGEFGGVGGVGVVERRREQQWRRGRGDCDKRTSRDTEAVCGAVYEQSRLALFEEMVDDSRLGKIKRRSGAHVGVDGRTVEWHVVELEGEDGGGDAVMGDGVISAETGNGNKRLKLGD